MSNRTFGIIGCQHGHIAGFLTEMLRLGHRCAGISETGEPALAERLSRQYGIPLVKEARSLLEDPEVSVIGSSAVNAFKLDVIEQCEAYGKHVMLDKPIAVNRHQLERFEGVIGRGGIQIGMMLTERFRPVLYTLSRMLERGELGKVVSLTMRKPHKLTPSSRHAWHFSKEQNGGIVIDLFVHDFDLLRWLTGQEIRSVQTVVTKNGMPEHPTFYDTACAQVVMDGGALAQLYSDWHTPEASWTWGDCRIFITGTAGAAELRLSGDPAIAKEELFFRILHDSPYERVELEAPPWSLTEDFLRRLEGKDSRLAHKDVLQTCRAAVEADEKAVFLNNVHQPIG